MSTKTVAQDFGALIGRICVSLIFIIAGVGKIMGYKATAAYMASKGLPMVDLLLVLSIIFELGGGLMVLFGWKARWGALLIFLFVIPVTFVFHSFWTYEAMEAQNQMHHFLKNLAIIGGALYIMVYGAGGFSIDGRKKKSRNI